MNKGGAQATQLEHLPKNKTRFSEKRQGKTQEMRYESNSIIARSAPEQFPKSGNRFSDKNCDKNNNTEHESDSVIERML